MKRGPHLSELQSPGSISVLNNELEERARVVEDAHVREGAAISIGKLDIKDMGIVDVGVSEVVVRHGLGKVPVFVGITMASGGTVYYVERSKTAERIKVQGDAANLKAWIVIFG